MADATTTFSESWYRIAGQHVQLRPQVQIRRQLFRGRLWYVLQDPFNNQFYRLRPAAYHFIARLGRERTVQQVWDECLARFPEDAPGQQDVIRLLSQLFYANMITSDNPADTEKLFERQRKRQLQETQSRYLNIMFARFPVLDPDRFLVQTLPLFGWLVSPVGGVLWLVAVCVALKLGIERFADLRQQTEGVLAPGNLFMLYVALVLIKVLHEFGHAYTCRKLGGEVHNMGIMLMIFTPVPYMDATAAWAFRSRWQRLLVGASGIMVEMLVAAFATIGWAYSGPGAFHSLCYNLMFIASVSTVLFNGNPLLRYDGYYMLSDLLDIPNLYQHAMRHLQYLAERYLFGYRKGESPAHGRREAWWLTVYGITSQAYRVVVFAGIIIFVANRFLLLGLLMAVVCFVSWVLVAVYRFVKYLAAAPHLERCRGRAVLASAAIAAALIGFLELVPMPYRFRAPGIVQAEKHAYVVNDTPGFLAEVLAPSGSRVRAGQPLFRAESPDLDFEMAALRAQIARAKAMEVKAIQARGADLKPVRSHLEALEGRVRHLEAQKDSLTVRARQDGLWTAPDLDTFRGAWLRRGTAAGELVDPAQFLFSAVIPQQEASRLFAESLRLAEVKVRGQADLTLSVSRLDIIPANQDMLPAASLGWQAGGEVAVDASDSSGRKAAEPFFQVKAFLAARPGVELMHGRSGRIRFELAPEPLLRQWLRKLHQLIQKRYTT